MAEPRPPPSLLLAPGYTEFPLQSCYGRNELMGFTTGHTLSTCAAACTALPDCVSFEYSAVSNACQLSSSCLEPSFVSSTDSHQWSVYVKDVSPSPPTPPPPTYAVDQTLRTYSQAQAHCTAFGGALVSIHSSAQNTAVRDAATAAVGSLSVWIGGTDSANEGTWVWEDGSTFAYTSWNPGEPNNVGNREE